MVMWPKLDNFSFSLRNVVITSLLKGFDQKNLFFFFEGWFWFKFNNLELTLGMALKFYISVAKASKLKSESFGSQEVTEELKPDQCKTCRMVRKGEINLCKTKSTLWIVSIIISYNNIYTQEYHKYINIKYSILLKSIPLNFMQAASRGVLQNLQNSQENTCSRVSFLIKGQA